MKRLLITLSVLIIMFSATHVHATRIVAPPDAVPAQEPEIAEVHRAALAYQHMDRNEAAQWKKKARLQALLPRFQVDYGQRALNDINVNVNENVYVGSSGVTVGPNDGTYSQKANYDQNFAVRAVWALNELIFNADQLAISREARDLTIERQKMLAEVNAHFFERMRLKGVVAALARGKKVPLCSGADSAKQCGVKDDPKDNAKESIEHLLFLARVKFAEETGALDALTGGWFSQAVNREP